MQKVNHLLMSLPILFLVLGTSPALAAFEQDESFVSEGQLVGVDPDAWTITIETEAGMQIDFKYSEATEISGTEEGVEGLAGQTGTHVRVHYRVEGDTFVADKVEVVG